MIYTLISGNPTSFVIVALLLFLPAPFAIRLTTSTFLLLVLWYELTPPTPFSKQGRFHGLAAVIIVIDFTMSLAFVFLKSIHYYGFKRPPEKEVNVPFLIDVILVVLGAALCGFFTITFGSRYFSDTTFDAAAHLVIFSIAIVPAVYIVRTSINLKFGVFAQIRAYFCSSYIISVLIGLVISFVHISSVEAAALKKAARKAYCITGIKSLSDMSFITMRKFHNPNLIVSHKRRYARYTWSYRKQQFDELPSSWRCQPRLNFIKKLPIF